MRMDVATSFLLRKDLRRISNQGSWQCRLDKFQSPDLRLQRGARACLATMRSPLMCPRPPQDTGVEVPSQQHLPSALVLVCLDRHVWESTDVGARQGSQGTWGPICPAWDRPGEHGQRGQPTGDVW